MDHNSFTGDAVFWERTSTTGNVFAATRPAEFRRYDVRGNTFMFDDCSGQISEWSKNFLEEENKPNNKPSFNPRNVR